MDPPDDPPMDPVSSPTSTFGLSRVNWGTWPSIDPPIDPMRRPVNFAKILYSTTPLPLSLSCSLSLWWFEKWPVSTCGLGLDSWFPPESYCQLEARATSVARPGRRSVKLDWDLLLLLRRVKQSNANELKPGQQTSFRCWLNRSGLESGLVTLELAYVVTVTEGTFKNEDTLCRLTEEDTKDWNVRDSTIKNCFLQYSHCQDIKSDVQE